MLFSSGMDAPGQGGGSQLSTPYQETQDSHRNSPAISSMRAESYHTFSFQAKLILGAALLIKVEEHLELIWPYRACTPRLLHKPVRSEIHLTPESSMFVASFKAKTCQTELRICGCHYPALSLHYDLLYTPQMSPASYISNCPWCRQSYSGSTAFPLAPPLYCCSYTLTRSLSEAEHEEVLFREGLFAFGFVWALLTTYQAAWYISCCL